MGRLLNICLEEHHIKDMNKTKHQFTRSQRKNPSPPIYSKSALTGHAWHNHRIEWDKARVVDRESQTKEAI